MKPAADQRNDALREIRSNIAEQGRHINVVAQSPCPRFAYTIGVSESIGVEIVLAGASFFSLDDIVEVLNSIAKSLTSHEILQGERFEVGSLGFFSLRKVDPTWSKMLLLGAMDFYEKSELPALQVVPDKAHWTIDVPDLSEPWSPVLAPVWQWLESAWTYPVPRQSTAVTNLAALRGERITEVMRWEDDQWEVFAGAGPDVPKDEMRVVPIGTLIAVDQSLAAILELPIEGGCWRDDTTGWTSWGKSGSNALASLT
jgi:hypothetical protein